MPDTCPMTSAYSNTLRFPYGISLLVVAQGCMQNTRNRGGPSQPVRAPPEISSFTMRGSQSGNARKCSQVESARRKQSDSRGKWGEEWDTGLAKIECLIQQWTPLIQPERSSVEGRGARAMGIVWAEISASNLGTSTGSAAWFRAY